jgi:hypothetical protein
MPTTEEIELLKKALNELYIEGRIRTQILRQDIEKCLSNSIKVIPEQKVKDGVLNFQDITLIEKMALLKRLGIE